MIFITGGAYQGKTGFALEHFGISGSDIVHGGEITELPKSCVCIAEYHLYIRKLLKDGIDPAEVTKALNADIVIMDDTGCGIIPLDREERILQEKTGMSGCILAERADTVIRMVCGIPQVIKGTL